MRPPPKRGSPASDLCLLGWEAGVPGKRFVLAGVGSGGPRQAICACWGGKRGSPASDLCLLGWEAGLMLLPEAASPYMRPVLEPKRWEEL
jgi:hypothetical protein